MLKIYKFYNYSQFLDGKQSVLKLEYGYILALGNSSSVRILPEPLPLPISILPHTCTSFFHHELGWVNRQRTGKTLLQKKSIYLTDLLTYKDTYNRYVPQHLKRIICAVLAHLSKKVKIEIRKTQGYRSLPTLSVSGCSYFVYSLFLIYQFYWTIHKFIRHGREIEINWENTHAVIQYFYPPRANLFFFI